MGKLRVLWTHNFDPARANSQVYMNVAAAGLRERGAELQLEYLGNLRSPATLMRARRRVRRLSADFDVVHAQYGSACALATASVSSAATVVSIRGNDWSVHGDIRSIHYYHTRVARAMTRVALSSFDCALSVSRRMAVELVAAYPTLRTEVFPSPIDLDRFIPRDRAAARAALGFPGNTEKWILFNALSLSDPIKRYPLAQQAVALANTVRRDLRLRVATGLSHDQLPLFAAACDLILCTSETEGWPNSVKEALACNVPFVSTDVSDLRDIAALEPSCRVCPADPQSLAEGIRQALEKAAPADLRKYVSPMGLEAATTKLMGIYEALVLQRHRAMTAFTEN